MGVIAAVGFWRAVEVQPAGASTRVGHRHDLASVSGTQPKQTHPTLQHAAAANELPQDEVQVQRDSEANGEIVVKYLDPAGDVILQVPSSEVLKVAHAIGQDLARESKSRSATSVTQARNAGGKAHGH